MAKGQGKPTEASLGRELHWALLSLYDPGELAKSPLIDRFAVTLQPDPPAALRRLLLEGIEGLKPPDSLPPQAGAWRTYRILLHRYVQKIPQREIAVSLGFSVRQLQRHERVALQALADYLWARHGLELQDRTPALSEGNAPSARAGAASQEMERLRTSFASEAMGIADLVEAALRTVAPLLAAQKVVVVNELPAGLPRLAVQTIPMRQALVSILTVAGHAAPGGRITIRAEAGSMQVRVRIQSLDGPPLHALSREDGEHLEMARQLVAPSGGLLELPPEAGAHFAAALVLPAAQQLGVLVIDDNVDALQLCRRYLEGSRYSFVGMRDPQQALALAQELSPKIVVLDVMLPGMDGWEVLGRLREHPATRRIPVIVSTILPHEQLALTLGAAGFLRKPVSREALLAALDSHINPLM